MPDRATLRRTALGPVAVTSALVLLAGVATVSDVAPLAPPWGGAAPPAPPAGGTALTGGAMLVGWLLPWLLLGLTAGYALSGSA